MHHLDSTDYIGEAVTLEQERTKWMLKQHLGLDVTDALASMIANAHADDRAAANARIKRLEADNKRLWERVNILTDWIEAHG